RPARTWRRQRGRARPRRRRTARHLCQRHADRAGRDRPYRGPLRHPGRRSRRARPRAHRLRAEGLMFDYILRLLILLPIVGGMAWGSLWLWKRVQMGVPLTGGQKQGRPIEMVGVLPLGPGSKLAVVEFAGQQILLSV